MHLSQQHAKKKMHEKETLMPDDRELSAPDRNVSSVTISIGFMILRSD